MRRVLITGAYGFVGRKLAERLAETLPSGSVVVASDVRRPLPLSTSVLKHAQKRGVAIERTVLDVCDDAAVHQALDGVWAVFHLASYGMSGGMMLCDEPVARVNVGGTARLLQASRDCGVAFVVYTSTVNTIFYGQPIEGEDEWSISYPEPAKFVDAYSRTKCAAEQLVLAANGNVAKCRHNASTLHTVALRSVGIYGPGEARHLPRIEKVVRFGLYQFAIGSSSSLVEWVHVDNLVEAHILALQALERRPQCRGRAYVISDQHPVNNFEFLRPFVEHFGGQHPKLWIPLALMVLVGWFFEVLYRAFGIPPFLTRAEVYKSGQTHYFRNYRANADLGYKVRSCTMSHFLRTLPSCDRCFVLITVKKRVVASAV